MFQMVNFVCEFGNRDVFSRIKRLAISYVAKFVSKTLMNYVITSGRYFLSFYQSQACKDYGEVQLQNVSMQNLKCDLSHPAFTVFLNLEIPLIPFIFHLAEIDLSCFQICNHCATNHSGYRISMRRNRSRNKFVKEDFANLI